MRITLLICAIVMTAIPVSADSLWGLYERETPASSWEKLFNKTINTERRAKDSVSSRCTSSRGASLTPQAVIKIVSPAGTEEVFVCADVRKANGTEETALPTKKGQINLWGN